MNLKNKKGITALVLVVTIIILMILTSVTIGTIKSGLFGNARNERDSSEIANEKTILNEALAYVRYNNIRRTNK